MEASYGPRRVLADVSIDVAAGQAVGLFGHNGAGKTTLLRVIAGFKRADRGELCLLGRRVDDLPAASRAGLGLSLVPDGAQGVFPTLTVEQHVRLGRAWRSRAGREGAPGDAAHVEDLVHDLFGEVLRERPRQVAGSLSGGQRQMLALALALLRMPRVLLLDEPSLGLAPRLVERLMDSVRRVVDELGIAVLIVEQDVAATLRICDFICLLKAGEVVAAMSSRECPSVKELWSYF